MVHDLFVSARSLARSPFLTVTASLTIAMGIGATTAIFSITNGVLLRPLPYNDPDRLVVLYADLRARENYSMPMSFETFSDIRNGTKNSFEDVAAVQTNPLVLPAADGSPERLRLALVTTNIFRVLGARVAIGRDFEDSDGIAQPGDALQGTDAGPPPPPRLPMIVILSHDYWQRRYGGNPEVVGQRIARGGGPVGLQIVGVLAPPMELLFPPQDNVEGRPDIWLANRRVYDNANRNAYGLRPIGRLKPGVPLARAQDEVEVVSAAIRRDFPIFGTAITTAASNPCTARWSPMCGRRFSRFWVECSSCCWSPAPTSPISCSCERRYGTPSLRCAPRSARTGRAWLGR
jgi:putative ABC transport system permease protein